VTAAMHTRSGHMDGPNLVAVWWRATRPFTFTASVTPVLVGTATAIRDTRQFYLLIFAAALLGSVAIQAATNLANEYYDHARGTDSRASPGPGHVIQDGLLSPRAVLAGSVALFALGSLLGLWLVAVAGWPVLALGVLSVLAAYAYTGGPAPLGYIGLGDLVVFVFMGPVIVLGAYYVQARAISTTAVWASVPMAALVTAILVVNNLRDVEDDRRKGKRTLATFIGPAATQVEYVLLIAAAYASIVVGVGLRSLPPAALLTLLTLAPAAQVCRRVRVETDPARLTLLLRKTAQLHQWMGLLLAGALLLG
jgi:1,4-dihydroxy-2-naphthoate polyprenyltransferase